MTARTLLFTAALALLGGLVAAGCSESKTGKIVTPGSGSTVNLRITNLDQDRIHVFVDGDEIGSVFTNQTIDFAVLSGLRVVSWRETGEVNPTLQGEFVFNTTQVVTLTHNPAIATNFRVVNNDTKTIDVFVDFDDKGSVQPGQTRDWKLVTGIRDVHIRETGSSSANYVGTFNINTSGVTTVTYP